MEELVDILDAEGRKTDEVRPKSEAHRDGLWHRCFHLWLVRLPENGEPSLVLQRRAEEKDTWPGRLDVAVGGHLSAGEGISDGVREAREELGLVVDFKDLIPLGERRAVRKIPQGTDREFHGVFLFFTDADPATLTLQVEEVASLVTMTLEAAGGLARGETVRATEHRAGRAEGKTVNPSELVDGSSEYFRWALRQIREALATRNAPTG